MNNNKFFIFLIPVLFLFTFAGCMVPVRSIQTDVPTVPAISKETVKQVEEKAADISLSVPLSFKEVNGYFLKNNVKMDKEINFYTAESGKKFEAILGQAKAVTGIVTTPDFKKNMAVVIAVKNSTAAYNISISSAYSVGSDIYINYEITEKPLPEVGYFFPSVKVFEIEKPQQVTNISFSQQGESMVIIPFGNRSAGSPASLQIMKKYYTGSYKGTLPAADGPGIVMVLDLLPDNTYTLKETYLSHPDRVFESCGKWAPTEDLSSFVLNYDKEQSEQVRFYFINRNTIEKLDMFGDKINSELYKLKK